MILQKKKKDPANSNMIQHNTDNQNTTDEIILYMNNLFRIRITCIAKVDRSCLNNFILFTDQKKRLQNILSNLKNQIKPTQNENWQNCQPSWRKSNIGSWSDDTHLSGNAWSTDGMRTLAMALYSIVSHTPTNITVVCESRTAIMCSGIPCQKCSKKLCTWKICSWIWREKIFHYFFD